VLKSILIGLDGSPTSEPAIELGILWAKQFSALLVGLAVVVEPSIHMSEPEPIGGDGSNREDDGHAKEKGRHACEQYLERFAAQCTEAGVSFSLFQGTGPPDEEILRESHRYDLVLFGHETHFRFAAIDRPNETLWNVLKRESRPVVIAPPKLQPGTSVVVAYNGSPHADRALQAFQSSGLDQGQEVCVLSADEDREEANRQAARAVEFLRLHQINAVPHSLAPVNSLSQAILDAVRQRNARLLVMGVYGHSTVREFLVGSLTTAILQASPVPVFLCH
jgi:nucleotide-binding universal stress UspA family protein